MLKCFDCFCIRKILWSEVGRIADKSWLLRKWYAVLACIPRAQIFKHYEKFLTSGNRIETKWVRILTFPTPNHEYGYLRRWYEESNIIEFEKKEFSSIRDYDEYLKFKFGDYMELPPLEKRKVHPVTELKLLL